MFRIRKKVYFRKNLLRNKIVKVALKLNSLSHLNRERDKGNESYMISIQKRPH